MPPHHFQVTDSVASPENIRARARSNSTCFLSFRTVSKLFYTGGGFREWKALSSNEDRSNLFLAILSPWEVEELASVHQYFTLLHGKIFDSLEDTFVAAIRREVERDLTHTSETGSLCSNTTSSISIDETVSPSHEHVESFQNYFLWRDSRGLEHGLYFFEKWWKLHRHSSQIEFLHSRSLQVLKGFIKLDRQDQTDICASVSSRGGSWLEPALEAPRAQSSILQREMDGERTGSEPSHESDPIKVPSDGWLRPVGYEATVMYNVSANHNFRKVGYVFWDDTLRDALYRGGIPPETLKILISGDGALQSPTEELADPTTYRAEDIAFNKPQARPIGLCSPSSNLAPSSTNPYRLARAHSGNGHANGRRGSNSRDYGYSHDGNSVLSDIDKDDHHLAVPPPERQHFARNEQRTILIKNLSDRVTHKDIVDIVRGGAILDIYLRSTDRSASVSFVEGIAAQAFMSYAKRNDIYIHGKRAELSWNDRQFILPGHVAGKIHAGASRNLIVRGVHPNITAERIREDLDHIHNLIVIDIHFHQGDAFISLNSVHNSLFARTCMMSRGAYKTARIEWFPDECAQPLPKIQHLPKKENTAPVKTSNPMGNRFQMLNMDGTEDGSEEDNESEIPQFKSLHTGLNWTPSTVVV
ncbi:hypothetical protein MMC18_003389 [Xylographa bjoerkii]|nr:hypothetical protein [Xylographa bjoerkii]